jgi:hypothetical protein
MVTVSMDRRIFLTSTMQCFIQHGDRALPEIAFGVPEKKTWIKQCNYGLEVIKKHNFHCLYNHRLLINTIKVSFKQLDLVKKKD